jgi:dipeptidase E
MKLLLTSAGLSCDSIVDSLLELTRKPFSEINLVFIPTAANVESGNKFWVIDDLINLKNLGFKQIDIVDVSALSKGMWLSRLKEADVIYVEGGNAFYLMSCMETSGLKDILPELLETRVYVGVTLLLLILRKLHKKIKILFMLSMIKPPSKLLMIV